MSHIARVGRRSWRVRAGLLLLYLVLTAGAVTTVYPFLLMVSTATKSQADFTDYRLAPRYFSDDGALFVKYAEDRYANNLDDLNAAHAADYAAVSDLRPPRHADNPGAKALAADWEAFARDLPPLHKKAGFGEHDNAPSALLLRYRERLRARFDGDIEKLNAAWTEENASFEGVTPPFERTARREWTPDLSSPKMADWLAFKASLPPHFLLVTPADPLYQTFLRQDRYDDDLAKLNAAWGTQYRDWHAIPLPRVAPTVPVRRITIPRPRIVNPRRRIDDPQSRIVNRSPLIVNTHPRNRDQRPRIVNPPSRINDQRARNRDPQPLIINTDAARTADWEAFVRTKYPLRILGVGDAALPAWRRFLHARKRQGAASASFPNPLPASGERLTDWMEFIHTAAPISALSAESAENLWRASLRKKYRTAEAANAAFATPWRSFDEAAPPQSLVDWNTARTRAASLRWEWATRNFRWVTSYILLHGRAVGNTVAFCLLAMAAACIVNPLCAYALSRYPLPYAYKVLLFLLATMAFPAEVAMIPNFLLLRDLGMLNTFWALVLPGLASGFSIFLLKGFFDSLPKELYEAGILDGAKELTMFRRITVPLSLPIFSVIALNAFTASYGAFLFALVVCQDPKMWTLMVWLYDLQAAAPQYVIMAALTLAALPTLVVFLFAQKVILRGIILPSFK